jgi:hypothetical protein
VPDRAALIRGADPRFHDLLGDATDLPTALTTATSGHAHDLLIQVRTRLDDLATTTIEDEGTVLVAAAAGVPVGHPRVSAMTARYGLHGSAPSTMEEIAQVLGVSRARVGQISQRIAARLPHTTVWAPVADQVVLTVDNLTPCSMAELNETLQDAGLTTLTWSADGLGPRPD